ncbi:hypothetical protein NMY22_g875 [Coprinellus aureogranulatus]|nr:hypothetical protein NMY22_g875 [Coprinellus aureogranulatus]
METSESSVPEIQDIEMDIGDEEYDCGYAMDLGAESPSPSIRSISGSPGIGSRSPSSLFLSSSGSTSASSLSAPNQDSEARLSDSIMRKPGGAGAVYKREVEGPAEADDRLMREWAVAAGIASVEVPPASPSKERRSRGPSVSAAYPPVTGVKSVSRRSSKSAQWDESDRDCGICFEYAVRPARTVCCGKVFCQEHLEDWLSGPNASNLCPNCDAECSLARDVLSLTAPKLAAVKPRPTKSSTGERRSSGSANTSIRRVVPSSSSGSGHGLDQSSVSKSSSSSFEPLSPPPSDPTSPDTTTSNPIPSSSDTPTPTKPKTLSIAPQQTLLSPPPRSRSRTPGQMSPSLSMQQQYERLLAQEHRPSSPLSTNLPIVNPFDSAMPEGGSKDILGGVESLGIRRGVKGEVAPGATKEQFQFPSGQKLNDGLGDATDTDTDSEKGYGGKEAGMWNVGKGGKKRVARTDAEYAHAVKHAASLIGCLVVLYLVVR